MTEYSPGGLLEGTLADLRTLMANPPGMRRGITYLIPLANPAAAANLVYKVDSAWWERIVSLLFTFTASAVAGVRVLSINLANGDGTVWNITPATGAVGAGEVWQVSSDLNGTTISGLGPSSEVDGSVTGPAAGATIVTETLPQGEWLINWFVGLGGTTAAADADNMQLTQGGVVLATSQNNSNSGTFVQQLPEHVVIPAAGAAIAVKAAGVATATAVYRAQIVAQLDSPNVSCPILPNLILKSGWQLQVVIAGVQAGDQISGVQLCTERYPSNYADGSLGEDVEELLAQLGG